MTSLHTLIFSGTIATRLGAITILLFITLPQAASAEPGQQTFNIPAGYLSDALLHYSEASGRKVLVNAAVVDKVKTGGVKGSYSSDQALRQLLVGSGLMARETGTGSITLEKQPGVVKVADARQPAEPPSETTLPKVTVEADAEYDTEYYADPYNKDYVIPNATAGTKTDTPIMETPLNVQVISKQVLKDQQVINLGQALKNVSGVTTNTNASSSSVGNGGIDQSITLRGFESQTFFRNGFRLQQGAANREMANVESVEVLKGPAAILYGLVEPGGMVNVITKQPLATPYYGLNQQFGSYDTYRTTVDATGPITKSKDLLYRMNFSYENSGSFRQFAGKEDVFIAPVIKWVISPKTQATFEMEYDHQHLGMDVGWLPFQNGQIYKGVPRSRNYGEYSPATKETVFGSFNWSHQFNDDWSIKHRFSVNQEKVVVSDFIKPQDIDIANNLVTRNDFSLTNFQNNTYSTNLDLVGHFDTFGLKHTLLLGSDYYRLNTELTQSLRLTDPVNFTQDLSTINFSNPVHPGSSFAIPLAPAFRPTSQNDQYGLYIQDQIKLPYNIHVMGGIRYQYLHQTSSTQFFNGTPTDSSAQSNDAVTPRVGILWQPKSWLSLYANYVESFGPSLVNGSVALLSDHKPAPPTTAEQYEGGIKTEFFGGRLRATLAYFDLTKTNIATPIPSNTFNFGIVKFV
jgi:iron complex outermembrane recepter protein